MDQAMLDMNTAHNLMVSKQNVTTTATAEASEKRRKTDANFVCPVPGCGSTFTRHFNLKGTSLQSQRFIRGADTRLGHLRSHNEEKPYQCKWPGCGKGFARAHDCKRHEQLHFNYRPHKCEGCGKSFQRMDALNRHRTFFSPRSQELALTPSIVRSEGGQDCLKAQEDAQTSAGLSSSGLDTGMSGFSSASINSAPSVFGVKSEDNWGMGVLM